MSRQIFLKYAKWIDRILFKPLVILAIAVTTICVVMPFAPMMPASGLDPSWQLAMNYEVSKGVSIGKDAVFTFGPFASIYTTQYYPDTDHMMMIGSFLIAFSFIILLMPIVNRSTLVGAGLLYLISILVMSRDAIFDVYCLIYVMVCWELSRRSRLSNAWLPVLAVGGSALSLLLAIKLSFLIPSVAAWGAGAALFLRGREYRRVAIVAVTAPPLSLIAVWLIAGQSLLGLYYYLINSWAIISGYTDAMSISGEQRDIVIYILAASIIMLYVFLARFDGILSRVTVTSMIGLFLFLGVKAGFVRHDGHAMSAGTMIGFPAVCLGLMRSRLSRLAAGSLASVALGTAFAAFVMICQGYGPSFHQLLFQIPQNSFVQAWNGIAERSKGDLPRQFNQAMAQIKDGTELPVLPGTSDIYPYDLADLISSGNTWRPRPVIQSYQAYGRLLAAEVEHLRGSKAPTNIFFRMSPIDGHYPLMENGPALPEILARYTLRNVENSTLILVRSDPKLQISPKLTAIGPLRYADFGQAIDVPQSDGAVFAVFNLDRSKTSSLVSLAFKMPILSMTVTLADGSDQTFRVISGMIDQGFILSPLIENVDEFAKLFANDRLPQKSVQSLRIDQEDGLGKLPGTYHVAFYSLALNGHSSNVRPDQFESRPPTGVAPEIRTCVDSLDSLNGRPPAQTKQISGSLAANGWLAIDVGNGALPEATYVTLKDTRGTSFYLRAKRNPRGDVAAYFHVPQLIKSGFAAYASTSNLSRGSYTLGLAVIYNGTLYSCSDFSASVNLQ